ncbi:MAG: hypothetical protein ACRDMV_01795 [Streptosporangiales bacterium]
MSDRQRAPAKRRRGLFLGITFLLLLCLLTTCVVVAQSSRYAGGQAEPSDPPERASMSGASEPTASPTPSESRPAATPWRKVHWRAGARANQIVGLHYPPKPPPRTARADPLRAGIALLAALDSTNPAAWKPGRNPLRPYMTARLDRIYTPRKGGETGSTGGKAEGGTGATKLPKGGSATYRFYCYVPDGHTRSEVTVACGYHVRVESASGKLYREDTGPQQQLTVKRGDDGWRVARIGSATRVGD